MNRCTIMLTIALATIALSSTSSTLPSTLYPVQVTINNHTMYQPEVKFTDKKGNSIKIKGGQTPKLWWGANTTTIARPSPYSDPRKPITPVQTIIHLQKIPATIHFRYDYPDGTFSTPAYTMPKPKNTQNVTVNLMNLHKSPVFTVDTSAKHQ